jgi:hypothetical protein
MTEREQIEQQIREVLTSESAAVVLSDKLFGPGGLFGRLANSEGERRAIAHSALFKEAQRVLSERQEVEAGEFARTIRKARAGVPQGEHLLKHQ